MSTCGGIVSDLRMRGVRGQGNQSSGNFGVREEEESGREGISLRRGNLMNDNQRQGKDNREDFSLSHKDNATAIPLSIRYLTQK